MCVRHRHPPIFASREVMVPNRSRPHTLMMVESCILADAEH